MRRISWLAAACCALTVWAAGAADLNFAGTWSVDKEKSENLGRNATGDQTWTITQDAKSVTVETKITTANGDRTTKSVYNLDGSETTADVTRGQMSGKSTTKAKWGEGNKTLETSNAFAGKRGDTDVTFTTKETWELSEDGKILKIARTREGGQNGAQTSKLVLNKK